MQPQQLQQQQLAGSCPHICQMHLQKIHDMAMCLLTDTFVFAVAFTARHKTSVIQSHLYVSQIHTHTHTLRAGYLDICYLPCLPGLSFCPASDSKFHCDSDRVADRMPCNWDAVCLLPLVAPFFVAAAAAAACLSHLARLLFICATSVVDFGTLECLFAFASLLLPLPLPLALPLPLPGLL